MREQVLFVDDDPALLDGLKRMLRTMRNQWEVTFASTPEEALQKMHRVCFDVVVSDMRMPGMSGSDLLQEVKQICPHSVRVILSGQADLDMILTSVGKTHQYLSKPCDAEALKQVVGRACQLRDFLPTRNLQEMVSQIAVLPAQAEVLTRLKKELAKDDPSIEVVAELIKTDVAISGQILQLVNSAFFGVGAQVGSVKEAAAKLGIGLLKKLILDASIFDAAVSKSAAEQKYCHYINSHSVNVANLCAAISGSEGKVEQAELYYTAGLLHDIGKLVFCKNSHLNSSSLSAFHPEEEFKIWGADHSQAGAYLLALWGVPTNIVDSCLFHHGPKTLTLDLSWVVFLADYLSDLRAHPGATPPLKLESYQLNGLEGLIAKWGALLI